MYLRLMLLLAIGVSSLGAARPPLPPADDKPAVDVPVGAELRRQILTRDQALFDLQFSFACDVSAMRDFVTEDMEFYHDHEGFAVDNADQWASDYGRFCAERKKDGVQVRRQLVRSTVVISRIPNYGAVETGEHLFFVSVKGAKEKLDGRSRFSQLWRLGPDGVWRISRDFSYDHREVK